jgi:hypothetical protein
MNLNKIFYETLKESSALNKSDKDEWETERRTNTRPDRIKKEDDYSIMLKEKFETAIGNIIEKSLETNKLFDEYAIFGVLHKAIFALEQNYEIK